MDSIISVRHLSKIYKTGFKALDDVNLEIRKGEIFALLGPNGAGKTTLINVICGIVNKTAGSVTVGGHDNIRDFRATRSMIGLVPQEIAIAPFENVWNTVSFTRGLMTLSGGMKRRVLIAKALSHEPPILFLDEPSAGVDVELRKDMWQIVRDLRAGGTTIILTTHYIEEAEEMADRVGVINKGRMILVEEKAALMQKLGKKRLRLALGNPLKAVPKALKAHHLELQDGGRELVFTYDTKAGRTGITALLADLAKAKIRFNDLETAESSLEDIFVGLVKS
jgi:ABC-2 type transport system ATP-binding protein